MAPPSEQHRKFTSGSWEQPSHLSLDSLKVQEIITVKDKPSLSKLLCPDNLNDFAQQAIHGFSQS